LQACWIGSRATTALGFPFQVRPLNAIAVEFLPKVTLKPPHRHVVRGTEQVSIAANFEQAPIDTVKAVIETPKPIVAQPEVTVTPVEVPVTKVEPKEVTPVAPVSAENKETVTEPDGKYNVVVACYGLKHLDLAMKFRDTIRKKGFKSNVYRTIGSKYYRVMTTSTDDKGSALQILRKSKSQIDSESWFYLYNKQ
jgi:hypothetical protein